MTSPQLRALQAKTCSVENCDRAVYSRGVCRMHRQRQLRGFSGNFTDPPWSTQCETPWNPWLRWAPDCHLCGSKERVYLWRGDENPLRWYCAPCDRFVRSESLTVACGSELGPGASSAGASGPSTEGGE